MDTDRQVQSPTAPEECQTMQPALLRDSTTLRAIKAEPVSPTDTGIAESRCAADTGPLNSIHAEIVNDTPNRTDSESLMDASISTLKCDTIEDSDTSAVIKFKTEPITDCVTCSDIKNEPVTDCVTCSDIKSEPVTDCVTCSDIKSEPVTDCVTCSDIKSEPVTDCVTCSDIIGDCDAGTNVKSEPDTDTKTVTTIQPVDDPAVSKTDVKSECTLDAETQIKSEAVTCSDTNTKSEPVTDTDTATTIQPVDDPAVSKTDTAVSMEPLPPREGQERLPSEPQPADKEVREKA